MDELKLGKLDADVFFQILKLNKIYLRDKD